MLKMNKQFCCMIIIFGCLLFTACSRDRPGKPNGTRELVDMAGRTVKLPEEVDRVFMDWSQGALHMMTLGALDKLVVVSQYLAGEDVELSTWARMIYPNGFGDIPQDHSAMSNIESLLNYKPDVVFSLYDYATDNIEKYENVGLTVIAVNFDNYETFRQSILLIGEVLGGKYALKAIAYNKFFTDNIALTKERLESIPEASKPSVYYVDSGATLERGGFLKTKGQGTVQASWIEAAGAKIATSEFKEQDIILAKEELLKLDPDYILFGSQDQAAAMQLFLEDFTFEEMKAVVSKNIYRVPQGIFCWCKIAPEACLQMVWAAKLFYPDLFMDINIEEMTKNFYFNFMDASVSDEIITKILEGKLSPTGA